MTSPEKLLLRAENLCQGFLINHSFLEILDHISISIYQGEMVAITGVSGSGKSTLLNILAGLDLPTRGSVYFKNEDILKLSESRLAVLRNRYMGFIFQQHHLIRELTTLENVMLPGMIDGTLGGVAISSDLLRHKAEKLIEQVGLLKRKNHLIGELSGGEAQRTAIARALIHSPEIVFADEPTGNLDENNSFETFSILKGMSTVLKTSIVMVSHSKLLTEKCDRIYSIENKKLTPQSS